MVTSVHLADVSPLRTVQLLRETPTAQQVPGLRYAESLVAAPISPHALPMPRPRRAGLIAAWDNDDALDSFLATHPVAEMFDGGYRVRLEPLRIVGAWPELGELLPAMGPDRSADAMNRRNLAVLDGPAAVLTLGRLRLRRGPAFLRASARAEAAALHSTSLVLATGLAHPPRIVATFSLWSDVAAMRAYVEQPGAGHREATVQHTAHPFHSQSAFIRFRPYDQIGRWHPPGT